MIFVVTITAMLLIGIAAAEKYKVNIGDGIAVSGATIILLLYVLAFFRGMKLIGVVSIVLAGAIFLLPLLRQKSIGASGEADTRIKKYTKYLLNPTFIMLVISVAVVSVLTREEIFSWWDDINFWSSDAKQLYFLNGFPGKYGNVSPEFGDYPPVTSIFKWLFLQINAQNYNESLQFAGYFALNMVFLMPLAGMAQEWINDGCGLKSLKRYQASVVCFAAIALLPGVFNGIIYYGTPADITTGIIYGALLLAISQQNVESEFFYYLRIALYSSVLFLTKSVGIEWAVFALFFYFIYGKKNRKILIPVFVSGGFYGSWLLFCFINRRVAKLTGAGLRMATSGTYTAPQNTLEKAGYFIEGFLTMPMHADSNVTFDISTGAAVLFLAVFLLLLRKNNVITADKSRRLSVFLLISGVLCYGIIFLAHISIFQTEDQYLDAYAMAVSIARYACPFALGGFYLLMGIFYDNCGKLSFKTRKRLGTAFILFILLTADYSGAYKHLWGYRKNVEEIANYCYDMVGDEGRILVNTVVNEKGLWGKRVLVMRDGHTYTWVHDAYISKEASPVALVYDGYLAEQETSDDMVQKILTSHASYIYVEDADGVIAGLFGPLVKDGAEFKACTVYKIEITDGGVELTSI
ncbi:MAG: hypothetical protein J6O61_03325 [Butyrivibrio sp.]|uniref:hypothetical protein n=1 Tax=Butyrivibrio sp. TaxID=28121 RepID=UPI001B176AC9|nr:hypothetical protein [Butyrivibrio sp.]MBO6239859.1 hypothetical protein [Butyrivibrio sp.]